MGDIVQIEGTVSKAVNFSMQQNYVPVIKSVIVKNLCGEDLNNLKISITVSPDFAIEWENTISIIPHSASVDLGAIDLKLLPQFLYSLTERIVGTIQINISHNDEVIESYTYNIDVLAYDEWSGTLFMPEIVCAFITPNNSRVPQIIHNASEILKEWGLDPSFTGYLSKNPNNVRLQMAAVYGALQKENIVYSVPLASYEVMGQRIRLYENIISQKFGTCLDLALLYAGCLEAVGINPLIIFMKGHAFTGCFLEDESFSECVQDDVSMLTKRIADGINEICLVETTCLVSGKTINFEDAVKAGEANLSNQDDFEIFVDVKRSRISGVRPLPLRKPDGSGFEISSSKDSNNEFTQIPKELEIAEKIKQMEHIPVTKQKMWERKLLDLSLRNTLINFRVTKNTLQLMVRNLGKLEDELSDGEEFQILGKPTDWQNTIRDSKIYEVSNNVSALESLAEAEFSSNRIRTFLDDCEAISRITLIYRQAKVSLEENGANTLYLALGFLKWYESDVSEKPRYAPIVLIPIDIVRKNSCKGYVVRIRDEEPQMNITLLEILRQDFGITIGGLDPLPTDDSGIDLKKVFNIVRQTVMANPKWDVEEFAFIGLFSFSQFIMWNDIRNRADDLMKNKIVASLISGKMEWVPDVDFPYPETLDERFSPSDIAVPISADSSQLSAICAAGYGQSFVLHGPPGTGKSQTITNIIANALFHGKSVLFIAEKMAALSVVQKRLEAIGLGAFCLELHSNKAKKKDVLEQLKSALETGKVNKDEDYSACAERLSSIRHELNEYAAALHKKREYGFSLYEAITRFEQYKSAKNCAKFSEEQIKKLNKDNFAKWNDIINELKIRGVQCGSACNNPLSELKIDTYTQSIKNEISETLQQFRTNAAELKCAITEFTKLIDTNNTITNTANYKYINSIAAFAHKLSSIEYIPTKLLIFDELNLLEDKVSFVCSSGKKREDVKKQLLSIYTEGILEYDEEAALKNWKIAEDSWFIKKALKKGKIVKTLKAIAKNGVVINKTIVEQHLNLISVYKANNKIINEQSNLFLNLYGLSWNYGKPDFDKISLYYNEAVEINKLISGISENSTQRKQILDKISSEILGDISQFKEKNKKLLWDCISIFENINNYEQKLSEIAGINFSSINENNSDWFLLIDSKINAWLNNLDNLRNWCSYVAAREKAIAEGLTNVIASYEKGEVSETELIPAYFRGLYIACAESIVNSEKCLAAFSGAVFENEIEKFKKTSDEFEALTKKELYAKLSSKIPTTSSQNADSSEISILQKAIRSGGRMMSIRKLFDSIPNLLRRLCPCMLMSPISVAQYIDPKFSKFDLVVFDEASQMPTCEAVGAIARGENVIVVGDPKQLPPTSFFASNQVDEDNYEKEDLESILDDCLAISMPQQHLLWHYRSRHESLIAFSNMQYYDNKLYTFPSSNDIVSKVSLVQIDGFYDRGKTKQNKAEAEAVVNEIIRRLKDPVLSKQSIGVVTFSSVQQNLIDDLLTDAFSQNPELYENNNNSGEPVFIKNLENVQGDERDVILFSIGYGPDINGKVAINFGPLNRDGGWRRLNVAVSRARCQMIVYSVLKPEQIDLSRTNSRGVSDLKAFLEFAKNGKRALPVKLENLQNTDNEMETNISKELKEAGFKVSVNIGCSEYKIDIGIVNEEKPEEYILGIMCDGRNYVSAKTARDRNILQDSVLKSLGWNIHHLWIMDWLYNEKFEIEKIKNAVDAAVKKETLLTNETSNLIDNKVNSTETEMPNNITQMQDTKYGSLHDLGIYKKEQNQIYNICRLPGIKSNSDEFCLLQNNKKIIEQLKNVINAEAPISRNVLSRRVISAWGIVRMGARLERRFDELFAIAKIKKTMSCSNEIYWNDNQDPCSYCEFRVPSNNETRRNVEDIAQEEIAAAVKYLLNNQISLIKSDLIKEIYKLFGFSRGNESIEKAINCGIQFAVDKGFISEVENDRIVIKG